ncbi:MAG: hypothetical protein OEZ06_08655 [Myxococcales bacterium]|nr:hypothetical protein [Myxococcales bacterium]
MVQEHKEHPTSESPEPDSGSVERAFEVGDFATVRRLLSSGAGSGEAQPQSGRLVRATQVDPVHAWILFGCLLLLLDIVQRYWIEP